MTEHASGISKEFVKINPRMRRIRNEKKIKIKKINKKQRRNKKRTCMNEIVF